MTKTIYSTVIWKKGNRFLEIKHLIFYKNDLTKDVFSVILFDYLIGKLLVLNPQLNLNNIHCYLI